MWDVVIVGGGPSGAMAAKKCAEKKLKTLVLEKRRLPRDKVCTGMVMSPMAKDIITKEFGEIPEEVLAIPRSLSGIGFHLAGREEEKVEVRMPLTWRRNLDYWFLGKAVQAGAQVWEDAEVMNVTEVGREYLLKVNQGKKETGLMGKFVVGADGAGSVVRRLLFPQLRTRYGIGYRECHRTDLGLDKNHWHVFFIPELTPYYFSIVHKEEFMLIDLGARPKDLKKLIRQAHDLLTRRYGLAMGRGALWCDACLEPILYRELFSGSFVPARNNCLLVGDAAGLVLPISGEGIGTALKSGLMAALSIVEVGWTKDYASHLYLSELNGLIWKLQELYRYSKKIAEEKIEGEKVAFLKEAWQKATHIN